MKARVRLLNGSFDPLSMTETVEKVFNMVETKARGWVCTVNVATLMWMRRDRALQSFVDRAALVVADGQPLVWSARLFDAKLPERVAGIDLLHALCRRAAVDDVGVYLLGSTAELLPRALEALRTRHPGLRIAGADGYFGAAGAAERVEAVARSRAAILFVGMGSPRQEDFIDRYWDSLGVAVAIGVGGSFDVLADARRRAHPRLQRAGLEWLVRLAQEPVRLLPRYLVTNSQFLRLIVDAIGVKLRRRFGLQARGEE